MENSAPYLDLSEASYSLDIHSQSLILSLLTNGNCRINWATLTLEKTDIESKKEYRRYIQSDVKEDRAFRK